MKEQSKQLFDLAYAVRKELELYTENNPDCLNLDWNNLESSFPNGACKLTSLILKNFMLIDFGLSDVWYVQGFHKKYGYHAWIEHNSIIYDLTIDQFEEYEKNEYVFLKESSLFHHKFNLKFHKELCLTEKHPAYKVYQDIRKKII